MLDQSIQLQKLERYERVPPNNHKNVDVSSLVRQCTYYSVYAS